MKKFNLLLLGVIFCGLAINANAQSETRYWENTWTLKVNCDGVVDILKGPVHGYVVDHYNPVTGVFEWYKFNVKSAELVSQITGEIFRLNGFTKGKTEGDYAGTLGDTYETYRRKLKGNQGSHYLVDIVWFFDASTKTWTLLEKEIKCL